MSEVPHGRESWARLTKWWAGLKTTNIRTPLALTVLGLAGGLLFLAVAAAVSGSASAFAVIVTLGILVDLVAEQMDQVGRLLTRAQLGPVARQMIREFGLVVLFTRIGMSDREVLLGAGFMFAVMIGRAILLSADRNATDLQMPKVLTRNITLTALEDTAPLSAIPPLRLILLSSLPLLAGAVGALFHSVTPFVVSAGAFAAAAGVWTIYRMATLVRRRQTVGRQQAMLDASVELAKLRPEVILYFSGPSNAIYQADMWLPVLEKLGRPVIVLLRERENLNALAPTTLPVLCIPNAPDLMDFRLPTVRAAFYVVHVGKNIHLLREPRMKHVFIGHGESDKVASVNPVSKGFDEIWVAGRASRERWAAAKVGVRDDAIVEVGRPQLGGIMTGEPILDRTISVLYAPTWEGWVADPFASSVPTMGPALVAWLLKRPNLRIIYKPHPFTGTVSRDAARAHAEIMSLIAKSGREGHLVGTDGVDDEAAWVATRDQHLVISGGTPTLYDCFNHSDLLIGDISSVVPDYVASGKPYLVPNPAGQDHEQIQAAMASTRAAYLLDPEPATWDAVLDTALGDDPLRAARSDLRVHLLGPRVEDPLDPWRDALADLIARANREWPDAEQEASRRSDD